MEKQQQNKTFNIIPVYSILPLILTVTMNMLAYYGGRLLAHNLPHHNLETPLDRMIPVVPWTLVIYWGCYLFWIFNYILIAREDQESVCRLYFYSDNQAACTNRCRRRSFSGRRYLVGSRSHQNTIYL